MRPFSYSRAEDIDTAVNEVTAHEDARFIAGGTNLLDLMKIDVIHPQHLVDITHIAHDTIENTEDGGLRLGALVTNADTAYHPEVEKRYPLLAHAILAGASPQLRNKATDGGNLLQRTRCYYFYDKTTACNKREPGSGCAAIDGYNRLHAIFGASEHCIATHPSDMCVALAALDARVQVTGPDGSRTIPFEDFHRLPGDTPEKDTNLREDEIITSVDLPPKGFADHYTYIKNRDRASYAFALVSVAATLEIEDNVIKDARIALGGVAHKPWRNKEAESLLIDKPADRDGFQAVAAAIVKEAKSFRYNEFKIELARRSIVRALMEASQTYQ
ncbi:xanthine dehydrogenase family protein subunit M [Fulvivirga kasyanovii]|uniref:Xanthine dehydrogenase family protein subunit M n=1 Tax=Fulvivirga kasyanovii TaxID=396812 RepID=A0ABW9RVC1_9BACT|nr:xanthine dehydrogenase family protein subunit M [Fulvivirga kasyanovii]MTI27642.1 xanthine dehydrogenase family protein subunit M [Fulvivirga kasyanovii]